MDNLVFRPIPNVVSRRFFNFLRIFYSWNNFWICNRLTGVKKLIQFE